MKKFIRIAIIAALVVTGFAFHSPAQAADAGVIAFEGQATIESPGLTYPVPTDLTGPTRAFSFSSNTCADASSTASLPAGTGCLINAAGTVTGYCGRSVGQGAGTVVLHDGSEHSYSFTWQSVGGELVITGSSSTLGLVNGVVTAAPTTGSCTTGATGFTIAGLVTAAKA